MTDPVQNQAPPPSQAAAPQAEPKPQTPPNGGVSDSGKAAVDPQKAQQFGYIDFDALPPEQRGVVQQRFTSLYKNMKRLEEGMGALQEHNLKLAERLETFLDRESEKQATAELTNIRSQIEEAYHRGEFGKAVELTEKMAEIKAKPKSEKKAPVAEAPAFTPQEMAAIQLWQTETDDQGNYKRPWALPDSPHKADVARIANEIMEHPDWADKPMVQILRQVDRVVQQQIRRQQAPAGPVLGNQGTVAKPKGNGTVQLSEEQKMVARKMGIPLDRYAKQLQSMRKGA